MFAERESFFWTRWPKLRKIEPSAARFRCRTSAAASAHLRCAATSDRGLCTATGSPGRESVTAFDVKGSRRPIRSLGWGSLALRPAELASLTASSLSDDWFRKNQWFHELWPAPKLASYWLTPSREPWPGERPRTARNGDAVPAGVLSLTDGRHVWR